MLDSSDNLTKMLNCYSYTTLVRARRRDHSGLIRSVKLMEEVRRVCPTCGRVLEEDFRICPYCGKSLVPEPKPAQEIEEAKEKPKGRVAGAVSVICVILGFFFFGIILSIVAMITGVKALIGKGALAKTLGAIGLIGGVLEFLVTAWVFFGSLTL